MLFQQTHIQRACDHSLSLKRQRGVVIVVALFIVALVATMAYTMMARIERDTRRTSLILRDTQAELYAQGSIAWAIDQLRDNWKKQKAKQAVDETPIKSAILSEKGYQISSTIYDMQSRYNVNNLTTPEAQLDFKRLLRAVMPILREQQAQQISSAISDWVINRPMVSTSELRLVKGMTAALFNSMQSYVVALPSSATMINIQNASAPVLVTLGDNMTLEAAAIAVKQLDEIKPLTAIEDFLNLDVIKNHAIADAEKKITLVSEYFLVETEVAIEKQHIVLYTLLERVTERRKPVINIIWQSKGIW
jgi:general secretion pathway protein K